MAFWGLNLGLAMMVCLSLFPGGVLQVVDVIANGYWHARSLAYTASPLARTLEWLHMPGDLAFMFAGALPLMLATVRGYLTMRRKLAAPDEARAGGNADGVSVRAVRPPAG